MDSDSKYPGRFSMSLSQQQKRQIKIFCALRTMTLKEWYERAFMAFLKNRKRLKSQDQNYLYRARPVEAESFSMVTTARVVDEMRASAKQDNVRYVSAYYTAVVEYLEKNEVNDGLGN